MAPDRPADRDLVMDFLVHGSEDSFRTIYRRHTPAVFLLASRLLGRGDRLAEDVAQETWIRAAHALSGFRWESSLRTWLCGIAIRCCLEAVRNRARRPESPLGDLERESGANAEPGDRVDLDRAIRRLPDEYREILVLHDVEGYTHAEIAELLEMQPGSSKSRLCRARRALRERLGGKEWRG